MINSHHKQKYYGAATLLITFVLFLAAVLIIIFSANYSQLQQKSSTNQVSNNQAFEAAEAGLEFGIQYLTKNSATILAGPVGGLIQPYSDSNTSNVSLANGSKYTITYSNPTPNNYTLILIKSTGTSADGLSNHVVQQEVQQKTVETKTLTNPSTVLGSTDLQGNANVSNTTGNTTIISGSTVSLSGSGSTTSQTGGSNAHTGDGADIQQNAASLQGLSADQFFNLFFNAPTTSVKSEIANFFPAGSTPSLGGLVGTSIWVDQSYSHHGNTVIGSQAQPVVLIINGDLDLGGTVTIYGFVYAIGNITALAGTPTIIGSMAASGTMTLKGTSQITFDPTTINNIGSANIFFAKVTGSWKDF